MNESHPDSNDPSNQANELNEIISADREEAIVAEETSNMLEGMWNPEDPQWQQDYQAHQLMHQAGLSEPGVNLDKIQQATDQLDQARRAVDDAFDALDGDSKSN